MPPEHEATAMAIYAAVCTFFAVTFLLGFAVYGIYRFVMHVINTASLVRRLVSKHTDQDDGDMGTAYLQALEQECSDLRPLVRKLGKRPLAREEP